MTTPRTNDAHEQSGPGPRQQGRLTSKSAPPACDASTTYDTCFIGLSHEQAINQDKYLRQMRLCQIHLDYHLRDMLDQPATPLLTPCRGTTGSPALPHPSRNRFMSEPDRDHEANASREPQRKPRNKSDNPSLDALAERARQRAQRAAREAAQAEQKYRDLLLDRIMQQDPGYRGLQKRLQDTRNKLTRQRVGRARKRDSIKAMEKRIQNRHRQIAEHTRQEQSLMAQMDQVQAAMHERRASMARELPPHDQA